MRSFFKSKRLFKSASSRGNSLVKNKLSLLSIYLTFFVDNLCWSIVFPIFAPYFLNDNSPLFATTVSIATKTTILGLFLMAFSLGQFLGAPMIGEYADKLGRRRALLLTIPCTLIGLLITAWSMKEYLLVFIFVGRLITGIAASNGSICLAAISDVSESEREKTKNFGYFSAIAGLSFILGAFVGGKLADPTINPNFSPNFPIWIACIFSALNFIFVYFGFKETSILDPRQKFSLFSGFTDIKTALLTKKTHTIFAIYFLFVFSWTILIQYIPVILVDRYQFTSSNIGDLALFVGVFWAIGSGQLKQFLLQFISASNLLKITLVISFFLTAYVTYPIHIYTLLALLGLCVIAGGIIWPLCTSMLSNLAPLQMQGKIMSFSQSIQALAMAFAALVGGVSFKWSIHIPFLIAATAILVSGCLYWTQKTKKPT
jgi:MFS transporter, DHA1 family, tetracycline resistance protein